MTFTKVNVTVTAMLPTTKEVEAQVKKAQKGNQDSFTFLHKTFQPQVTSLLRKLLRYYPDDVEDLCQEVFAKAFSKINDFKGHSQFETWLSRIAINTGTYYLRKKQTERSAVSLEDIDIGIDDPRFSEIISHQTFEKLLEGLPENQQVELRLRAEGKSHPEIAAELGKTRNVSQGTLDRAKKNIRRKLRLNGAKIA